MLKIMLNRRNELVVSFYALVLWGYVLIVGFAILSETMIK
jgi:hypothetical protein